MPPTNNYACPRATTFQSRETVSTGSIGFRNGFRLPCLKGHNSIRPRQYRGLAIPTPEAGKKRRRCEGGVEISAVLVGCRRARSVQEDRFSYLINTTNTRDDLRDRDSTTLFVYSITFHAFFPSSVAGLRQNCFNVSVTPSPAQRHGIIERG